MGMLVLLVVITVFGSIWLVAWLSSADEDMQRLDLILSELRLVTGKDGSNG